MSIKRSRVVWASVVLICGTLVVWCLRSVGEPAYQGKPISYWLKLTQGPPPTATPGAAGQSPNPIFEAKLAVAEIGPSALLYVAKFASANPPPLARAYAWVYGRLPSPISKRLPAPSPARCGLGLILTAGYFAAVAERAGTNAIPMLVKFSTDKNPDVRRGVILALSRVAAHDHAGTLPVFAQALKDSDRAVRFDALRQLCQMAGTEPRVGEILTTYVNSVGTNLPGEMRFEALAAAQAATASAQNARTNPSRTQSAEDIWSHAFSKLSDWQSNPTEAKRKIAFDGLEAVFSLQQEGLSLDRSLEHFRFSAAQETSVLVPLLARALRARTTSVRNGAARLLQDLGPAAQPAVPEIVAALDGDAPPSPSYLVNALAHIGPASAPAVPTLIRLLDSEGLSGNAIFALSQIGPQATAAVPALLNKAKTATGDERLSCLGALADIAPQTPELLPQVIELLKSSDAGERSVGSRMLARMGTSTANVLEALETVMLDDEWLDPRLDAAEAIYRLDPKRGVTMVTNVIELIGWTDAEDHVGPARMARLLGQIGRASPEVLAELTRLFVHKEETVKIAAAETLVKLSIQRKPESVAVLRNIMTTSKSGTMRFCAAKTLFSVAPDQSGEVVAQVACLLQTDLHFYQQTEAAAFLGEVGAAARAAVPQLRAVLESQDWKLRRAAFHALAKIEKHAP